MANHVNTNVRFHKLNKDGLNLWKELQQRIDEQRNVHSIFGEELTVDEEGNETGPGYYVWNINRIGAKWAMFEDVYDDGFRIESAWDTPTDFLVWLSEQLCAVDPDCVMVWTSEDEFPNWFNAGVLANSNIYDYEHWEWEEFLPTLLEKYDDLAEHWNAEEQEFDDEGREILWDCMWEEINETEEDAIRWILESMEEEDA